MTDDELKACEAWAFAPERGPARALAREVRRLKALVKSVEKTSAAQCCQCPWCQADVEHGEKHFDCPAFTPDGEVR